MCGTMVCDNVCPWASEWKAGSHRVDKGEQGKAGADGLDKGEQVRTDGLGLDK